jgi:hypothetical protein
MLITTMARRKDAETVRDLNADDFEDGRARRISLKNKGSAKNGSNAIGHSYK